MSLTMSAKGGSSFTPIEAGTYPAICYGLVDIGYQYNEAYKKSSPKVIVMWEIPSEKITIGDEEHSRTMSQVYTSSLSEKATLRRDLVAWRGREFTDKELEGFDLNNILGAPCLLNIVHKERNGSTYANISAIMKLPKGMEKPVGTMPVITFDLDKDPLEMIEKLPEWIQKRITESDTYKERTDAGSNTPEAQLDDDDSADFEELDLGDETGLPF